MGHRTKPNRGPKGGFQTYGKSIEFNENVVFYSLSGAPLCSRTTKKGQKWLIFCLRQTRPKSLLGCYLGPPRIDNSSIWGLPMRKSLCEMSQNNLIVNSELPRRAPLISSQMGPKTKKAWKTTFPEPIPQVFGIFT